MKARRIMALVLCIFAVGATSAAAGTMWGSYGGNAKVKVVINGEEKTTRDGEVPPLFMDGSTMLPAKMVIDSFGMLMHWDQAKQSLDLSKPDVSMTIVKELTQSKNGDFTLKTPFGKVNTGDTVDFAVFVQVENMKAAWSNVDVALYSPKGDKVVHYDSEMMKGKEEEFWLPVNMENVKFEESGAYTVRVSFKSADSDKYTVVAQKQIISSITK
jgi:Copper amine oxidase N-terminal domain